MAFLFWKAISSPHLISVAGGFKQQANSYICDDNDIYKK